MATVHDPLMDDGDGPSSFQPLVRSLWTARKTISVAFVGLVLVVTALVIAAFVAAPRQRVATLGVRLTFAGAEQDRYPNGTKFSSADLVATPVLADVFRANELERYLSFSELKESMVVLHSNPALDMLSSEYQTRLADPKLTPVDRIRIEEEFRKKSESLRLPQYSLILTRNERTFKIPDAVLGKVLTDTVDTWARQAADLKGAVRIDRPMISKNALRKDFLAAEDYAIGVDILRSKTEAILRSIDEYKKIPGAATVRIGKENVTLTDVEANLSDVLRFKLEPLFGKIRAAGISRDAGGVARYFESRLLQVQRERDEAAQRVQALQEGLREYLQRRGQSAPVAEGSTADRGMPQLSESFLDRMLVMSAEANDLDFRQDLTNRIIAESELLAQITPQVQYYDSIRRVFTGASGGASSASVAEVTAATDRAYLDIATSLDQLAQLYDRIGEQHLNPSGVLYSIISPFATRTIPSFPLSTAVKYVAAAALVGLLLIPLFTLAAAYARESVKPAAPRDRGVKHLSGV